MKPESDRTWEQTFSDMMYWKWEGTARMSVQAVSSAVGFMERALRLTKGAKVLDLGGALGHHSIELSRRGYEVTGLESSEAFLDVARQNVADAGVSVRLIQGDMTRMTFAEEFNSVILWGNTFGMFSDENNAATLIGIARALRPGGLALIDTQNYQALPDKLTRDWRFCPEDKDLLFLEQATKDIRHARFGFDVVAVDLRRGLRHKMTFSRRLYLLPELERLLDDAGLDLLAIYGDDPRFADWKNWRRGEPDPYCPEGFTERAAKRILLCRARKGAAQ